MEAGKSKIKVLADLVPGERHFLPGRELLSHSHGRSFLGAHSWREREIDPFLSVKDPIPCYGSHSYDLIKPNHLPKTLPQVPSNWGLGLQHKNLGKGHRLLVHNICFLSQYY